MMGYNSGAFGKSILSLYVGAMSGLIKRGRNILGSIASVWSQTGSILIIYRFAYYRESDISKYNVCTVSIQGEAGII